MARPGSSISRRRLAAAAAPALLLAGGLAGAASAPASPPQSVAPPSNEVTVATAIDPDTARVGESLVLGITVRAHEARSVGFPALLPLADPLEQRGAIEQRAATGDGEWRAYYRIVAWRAGEQRVPSFEVAIRWPDGERRLEVSPGRFFVASVLPADTAGLELRPARSLLRITGPSWAWLLLLGVAAALLLYWVWRRRAGPARRTTPASPFERALESLRRLRRRWEEGRLTGPELYDGLEGTLREYVGATRAWRPGASLKRLTNGNRALSAALAQSALVRFARVAPSRETPLASIDAGESWVREDAEARARTVPGVGAREREPASAPPDDATAQDQKVGRERSG